MLQRALLLVLMVVTHVQEGRALSEGDAAPKAVIRLSSSSQFSVGEFAGKIVYIDFWASWCAPCKKSLPWLQELQRTYAAKGLKVIAINLDQDSAGAEKFATRLGINELELRFDPQGASASAFGVRSMPSAVLLDRTGHVRKLLEGFQDSDKAKITTQVEELL